MSAWRVVRTSSCQLKPGEIHVWRVALSPDASPSFIHACERLLSTDERERAARFRTEQLRTSFALAHGAMRRVLSLYTGAAPEALRVDVDRYGKPALRLTGSSGPGALHFNLSHSGELALVAVGAQPLGIDVEQLRSLPDAERLAFRFFSTAEYQAFQSTPADGRLAAFFRCWTRKEAFVKAIGEGLSYPLASFAVSLEAGESRLLHVDNAPDEAAAWQLPAFEPADGYHAAVAIRRADNTLLFLELPS